jgi:hypothetical protein
MQTVSTIGFDIAMEQRANIDVEIAMRKLALKAAQPPKPKPPPPRPPRPPRMDLYRYHPTRCCEPSSGWRMTVSLEPDVTKEDNDNCIDPRDDRADWDDILVDTTLRRYRCSENIVPQVNADKQGFGT